MSEKWVGGEMRRYSSGFTMVEMMIVLFVFAIVAAVAVPSINSSLDEMKLDGAAREVVAALHYVQSLSIKKEGESYGVKFNKTTQFVRCFVGVGATTILHPIDKKPYILDFTGAGHLQGLNLVSTTFVGNKVNFNALGEPSESGSIILEYAGLQKTINVSLPLGRVSVN
jgi:prepilin-type N-terminal cleavage/methylation domain-containing protein